MKQNEKNTSRRHFLKMSSMTGLTVAFSSGAVGGAFAGSKSKSTHKGTL
jgi:hypothetical protein